MYQVFSHPPGQPRTVLGYFPGNIPGEAIAAATVALNLPPNAPAIGAWLVLTRCLVQQQVFISIRPQIQGYNEGAISHNANTVFVNCRAFLGQQGHNVLHHRMNIDGMFQNANGGYVMGAGGGVGFVGYRDFENQQQAIDYLQSLGFNLNLDDGGMNLINPLNLPQNNAGALPANNQAPLVQVQPPKIINYSIPDLTIHPPRSVRVRIGGYAHLARLLDKARAEIHGKNAGYHYDCPIDKLLFAFTGVSAEAMLAEIKSGKSDLEILTWLNANTKRQAFEVIAWSAWLEQVGPGSAEGHEWIAGVIKGNNSARDDIRSFAEMLDLDDYISYGGKA